MIASGGGYGWAGVLIQNLRDANLLVSGLPLNSSPAKGRASGKLWLAGM